jgi:REP element-mobilizing transposase RayT
MGLSEAGKIVAEEWQRSAEIRTEIELDQWAIMPNHLHGIIFIKESMDVGAHGETSAGAHGRAPLPRRAPRSLGSIIAGFKAITTKRINALRGTPGAPVWQRNYYEHILRDEADLARIRNYILGNPSNWDEDRENPAK